MEQLRYYSPTDKDRWKIMVDIYGSQNEVLLPEGLADAIYKDDFKAKLASSKPAWEVIAPGFHFWFQDNFHRLPCFGCQRKT